MATGSALSLVAEPVLSAYCAAKAGILNLVKSIAMDYGTKNIRANCVCPGCINTPLGDKYFDSLPDPAETSNTPATGCTCVSTAPSG